MQCCILELPDVAVRWAIRQSMAQRNGDDWEEFEMGKVVIEKLDRTRRCRNVWCGWISHRRGEIEGRKSVDFLSQGIGSPPHTQIIVDKAR